MPLIELLLHRRNQIGCFVFLDGDIGISRHTEWVCCHHLQAGEEAAQVIRDDLLQPDKLLHFARPAQSHLLRGDIFVGADGNQSGKDIRHFHARETVAAFGVLHHHGKIKAQTRDMRKGMSRIKG